MQRGEFIKTCSLSSIALLNPNLMNDVGIKKLTILHTNDQHSQIEPFDNQHKRHANQGGFSRRATLIEQIRKKHDNVLLLDAGDVFQGTPYFNFYKGELEFKLMSKMDYCASTMGNHDFDNGLQGFLSPLKYANFDFICSNYDFSNTILEGKTKKYKTIIKDGIKIGIFGLGIKLEGLVTKDNYLETKYLNPIEIATDYAYFLKIEKKCDFVICLSHLGLEYPKEPNKISDVNLAKQTKNIDLIIGGHTHSFLHEPKKIKNLENKEVLINQVGYAGILLGKIEVYFKNQKPTEIVSNSIQVNHLFDEIV